MKSELYCSQPQSTSSLTYQTRQTYYPTVFQQAHLASLVQKRSVSEVDLLWSGKNYWGVEGGWLKGTL